MASVHVQFVAMKQVYASMASLLISPLSSVLLTFLFICFSVFNLVLRPPPLRPPTAHIGARPGHSIAVQYPWVCSHNVETGVYAGAGVPCSRRAFEMPSQPTWLFFFLPDSEALSFARPPTENLPVFLESGRIHSLSLIFFPSEVPLFFGGPSYCLPSTRT